VRKLLLVALVLVGLSVSWRSQPPAWDQVVPPAEAFYRASIIKSIQTGTCSATGTNTCNATLTTAVNSTSTIILDNGQITADSSTPGIGSYSRKVLAGSTTVTGTCANTTPALNCTADFTAIEFFPNVLSATGVQRGVITIGAAQTSNIATITAVVTSKTAIVSCGWTGQVSVGNNSAINETRLVLTNSTTVTASINTVPGAATYACWQTAEFKG